MNKHVYNELYGAWNSGNAAKYSEIVSAQIDVLEPHHKIRDGRTAFWLAAAVGATSAMRLLHKKGADANSRCESTGWTPLQAAVFWNHFEALQVLISEMRADVNARDKYGQTALMKASIDGRSAVIEYLLTHGANVDAVDNDRRSALMMAASRSRADAVKALLEIGKANVQLEDKDGRTAEHYAKSGKVRDMLTASSR